MVDRFAKLFQKTFEEKCFYDIMFDKFLSVAMITKTTFLIEFM